MDDEHWHTIKREIDSAYKYSKNDPELFNNRILPVLQGKTKDELVIPMLKGKFTSDGSTINRKEESVDETYQGIRRIIDMHPEKWQDVIFDRLMNHNILKQQKMQLPTQNIDSKLFLYSNVDFSQELRPFQTKIFRQKLRPGYLIPW